MGSLSSRLDRRGRRMRYPPCHCRAGRRHPLWPRRTRRRGRPPRSPKCEEGRFYSMKFSAWLGPIRACFPCRMHRKLAVSTNRARFAPTKAMRRCPRGFLGRQRDPSLDAACVRRSRCPLVASQTNAVATTRRRGPIMQPLLARSAKRTVEVCFGGTNFVGCVRRVRVLVHN